MTWQAEVWIWFGVAWLFLLAVLFKRNSEREHRDAEATEEALKHTRRTAGHEHEMDML